MSRASWPGRLATCGTNAAASNPSTPVTPRECAPASRLAHAAQLGGLVAGASFEDAHAAGLGLVQDVATDQLENQTSLAIGQVRRSGRPGGQITVRRHVRKSAVAQPQRGPQRVHFRLIQVECRPTGLRLALRQFPQQPDRRPHAHPQLLLARAITQPRVGW
ncbi:MAG: hypothetical protein IPH86_05565 [bacterium]|nr:hypothetical protein [bacterium]